MNKAVLYHDDADGFGAAWACWRRLGEEAVYIPVQYGQPVPVLPEGVRELFIVDFSYDRETCMSLALEFDLVIILDHHKSAEKDLLGLPFACFDQEKSGAVLAWEFMFPHSPTPLILDYVQDRDLWKFELPGSELVNLYIGSIPREFDAWNGFSLEEALTGGRAIKGFRDAQVERVVRGVRLEEIAGFTVPVCNVSDNISEVGHRLCEMFPSFPFSASYCDRGDGRRSYSLRSVGEFDVAAVAKRFGGGGHRNAAGFSVCSRTVRVSKGVR